MVNNGSPPFSDGEDIPPPPKQKTEEETRSEEMLRNTFQAKGEKLQERLNNRRSGAEKPIATPWTALDDAIGGGLWPGLHFVIGSTGTGKSQFALQIALDAAKAGVPVLYIALELGELDLFARAAGILSPAIGKWSEFFLGEKPVPQDLLKELQSLPFHWIVAPPHGWAHDRLEPAVKTLRSIYSNATNVLVVIDFAQLLTGEGRELRERISRAAYAARAVAREYNATVLMLSSTSRDNYQYTEDSEKKGNGQDNKKAVWKGSPTVLVGLGKESGDTEYASDSVMVLVKEAWKDSTPPAGGTRFHLAVAKLRAGSPSWVDLCFNGSTFTPPPTGQAQSERKKVGEL